MFGYATDETEECMPLTLLLAHKLNFRMKELSRSGECPWIRPDCKSQVSFLRRKPLLCVFPLIFWLNAFMASLRQVTVEYRDNMGAMEPLRIHTVVISVQHSPDITLEEIRRNLMEKVVKAVVPAKYLDDNTIYHLLPSGKFLIGGPQVSSD